MKNQNRFQKKWLPPLIGALIGGAIAVVAFFLNWRVPEWLGGAVANLWVGRSSVELLLSLSLSIALLILASWFSLIVHELGHALFGFLAGFDLQILMLGSFTWVKEGSRFVFYQSPKYSVNGLYVGTLKNETRVSVRFFLMILGGILGNLSLMIFAAIILVFDVIPSLEIGFFSVLRSIFVLLFSQG